MKRLNFCSILLFCYSVLVHLYFMCKWCTLCCADYHLLTFLLFMLVHIFVFSMQCYCQLKFHIHVRDNKEITYLLNNLLSKNAPINLQLCIKFPNNYNYRFLCCMLFLLLYSCMSLSDIVMEGNMC